MEGVLPFETLQQSAPKTLSHSVHRSPPEPLVPLTAVGDPSCQSPSSASTTVSREEAVAQARSCLATAVRKPLNNSLPGRKVKKQQRQPRFHAEIPVIDDSPGALARLAFDVFCVPEGLAGEAAPRVALLRGAGARRARVQELGGLGIGACAAGFGGARHAGHLRRGRVPGAGAGAGGQAEGGRERAGPEAGRAGIQGRVAAEAAADDRRGGEHVVQPHGRQLAGDTVSQVPGSLCPT